MYGQLLDTPSPDIRSMIVQKNWTVSCVLTFLICRRNSDGGAPVTAKSQDTCSVVTSSLSFEQDTSRGATSSLGDNIKTSLSSSSSTPPSSPWKTATQVSGEQEQRPYLDDQQSRRCSRNSQDEVPDEGHEAREMKRTSRVHSSLRTPKHSHAKLTYRNVLDSDSDQDLDTKPRRHSFREPRGCHTPEPGHQRSPDMGRRSQRTSPKTSLANDMLMVQAGGERWGVRRHSAVSVMSDTVATMVRRPSIVNGDQDSRWSGCLVTEDRRPSGGDSRRGSHNTERRRSSVTGPHGYNMYPDQHSDQQHDNNITIVVSQDDINSNSRNGKLDTLQLYNSVLFQMYSILTQNCTFHVI